MSDEDKKPKKARRGLATNEELDQVKYVLGTLISWMAQSSVTPISVSEAEKLLEMLS